MNLAKGVKKSRRTNPRCGTDYLAEELSTLGCFNLERR